jgi:hypothetical protein
MTNHMKTLVSGAAIGIALFAGYSFRAEDKPARYIHRQFSTVESVVPGGLGRSRIIISDDAGQEVGKDLLNFYSMVGINFKNIASNDRMIVETIDKYVSEGWELHTVTTGVQSPTWKTQGSAGNVNGSMSDGIFITHYLFRKPA